MKKTSLIFISTVVLFSLINISLVKADTNFIAAVIDSSRYPVAGALVKLYKSGVYLNGYACYTDDTGFCYMTFDPSLNGTTQYGAKAFYPDSSTRFGGPWFFTTDTNGNGKVTICPDGFSMPECDAIPPTYFNANSPNSGIYSPNTTYNFNVTWTDENAVDKVFIEIRNSTNVLVNNASMTIIGGNNYIYSIKLPAGTWYWKSYANDTADNWASTDTQTFTISKATPTGSLSTSIWSVTYPTPTTVSCSLTSGDPGTVLTLKRDGSTVSSPSETITLGYKDGGYSYSCEYPETQNYSATTLDTQTLTVIKGALSGSIAGSDVAYPAHVNVVPSESNTGDNDVVYYLYRNDSLVLQSTGYAPAADTSQLGAGTYIYKFNSTGGTNYTANPSIATKQITVSQASSIVSLLLNNLDSNITVERGNTTNVTANLISGGSNISVYKNDQLIYNGTSPFTNLTVYDSIGTYNITVFYPGDNNYTSSNETHFITVQDTTPPVIRIIFPTNTSQVYTSVPISYPLTFTVNENTSWIGYSLDGKTNITFGYNKPVGQYSTTLTINSFGSHNIMVYANDTSGNTGASSKVYFTIKQGGGGNLCMIRGICKVLY